MERGGSPNGGDVNLDVNVDVEAQHSIQEPRSSPAPLSRLLSRRERASMTGQAHPAEIESVKSQDSNTNRLAGSRRFAVPGFMRIWGRNNTTPQSNDVRYATASPAPLLPIAEPQSPTRPEPIPIDRDVNGDNELLLKIHWKRISLKSWVDRLLDGIEDGGNTMKESAIATGHEEIIGDIPSSSWAVYHGFDRGA
ncbi:hypothetical protein J7337_005131 [Fusarium musae]|uniref:Uncharacterized protein n=1 Tax=Fusarium musae TaxID=1042133 RepID=A0A9P8DI36_9HYPO|nr:hypothetical protein J7337_005131 [Fusarium musae]KAG9502304.1 hypothetical protein J7337_005131 [Fusarium musae]